MLLVAHTGRLLVAHTRRPSPGAVLWCDGRRRVDLYPGARVEVQRGGQPVLLARLRSVGAGAFGTEVGASFTDRLVAKFGLPVTGWRGRGDRQRSQHDDVVVHERFTAARQRDEEPGGDA
jgi:NAD+ kinase